MNRLKMVLRPELGERCANAKSRADEPKEYNCNNKGGALITTEDGNMHRIKRGAYCPFSREWDRAKALCNEYDG